MNKAAKLIFWQRITIATLAATTLISMWQAHLYQMGIASDWQAIDDLRCQISSIYSSHNQKRADDQKIIADRNRQLQKYEARFGSLPGEGETNESIAPNKVQRIPINIKFVEPWTSNKGTIKQAVRKTRSTRTISAEDLRDLYETQGLPSSVVAARQDVTLSNVLNWLRSDGTPVRGSANARSAAKRKQRR